MAKKNKKAEAPVEKKAKKTKKAKKAPVDNGVVIMGHPIRNLLIAALAGIILGGVLIGATYAYVGGITAVSDIIGSYFGIVMGALVAILGVVYIIVYFKRPGALGEYHYEFGIGLAAVVTGAYLAVGGLLGSGTDLSVSTGMVYRVIGILVLVDGILKVQYSLDMLRMKFAGWWLQLVLGILGLGLGVVIILGYAYSLGADLGLGGACGIGAALALNGILDLVALISAAVCNKFAKTFVPAPEEEAPVFDDYYAAEAPAEEEIPVFPEDVEGAFTLDVEPEPEAEEVPVEE